MREIQVPSPDEMAAIVDDSMKRSRKIQPRAKRDPVSASPAHNSQTDIGGFGGSITGDEPGDFDWPDPLPLDTQPKIPPFPAKLIPGVYGEMVQAVAESRSVPTALPGMLMLSVLGSCYAKGWKVWGGEDWSQPTNLYVIVALESGSRKSAVFSDLLGPVYDYEGRAQDQSRAEIGQAESRREIDTQTLKALQRKAIGRGEEARQAAIECDDLASRLETESVPVLPRLIVDDITPEALASVMSEQGGRALAASAECDLMGIMQGRYSDARSGGSNLAPFLKGHDGDLMTIDRRGRKSERVPCPLLSMAICAQPNALAQFLSNETLRERGLTNRFLVAVPPSGLGDRPIDTTPIPAALSAEYERALVRALDARGVLENDPPNPPKSPEASLGVVDLSLAPKASEAFRDYREYAERSLRDGGAFDFAPGFGSKLSGSVLRISAIIELSKDLKAKQVSPASMLAAIDLATECLEPHAIAARGMARLDDDAKRTNSLLRWLCRTKPRTFSRRDAFQALKGGRSSVVKKSADLMDPIERLKDHGYIVAMDEFERVQGRPGRNKSPSYEVHPGIRDGSIVHPASGY